MVLHAALIGAAVAATGRAAEHAAEPAARQRIHFVPPRAERAPDRSPARGPGAEASTRRPAPNDPPPPSPHLPVADAPTIDLGPVVPGPDLAPTGEFARDGLTTHAAPGAALGAGAGSGAVLGEAAVDEPVVPDPRNPPPRYPESMRAAGAGGRVVARFVVDTLGRIEPGSVEFLAPGDPRLEGAVREALARARFRPARAGGRRVRQLAERAFAFAPAAP